MDFASEELSPFTLIRPVRIVISANRGGGRNERETTDESLAMISRIACARWKNNWAIHIDDRQHHTPSETQNRSVCTKFLPSDHFYHGSPVHVDQIMQTLDVSKLVFIPGCDLKTRELGR